MFSSWFERSRSLSVKSVMMSIAYAASAANRVES